MEDEELRRDRRMETWKGLENIQIRMLSWTRIGYVLQKHNIMDELICHATNLKHNIN